jgi:ribosomal protein S20
MKELTKAAHDNKTAELPELLKGAYSIIDTAFKKNLIKRNNAARKKSNMAKAVATAMNKGKSTEASA